MLTVRVCSKWKTRWKSVVFTNKVRKNSPYSVCVFNKAIIPLALVGYEIIITNSAPHASLAIYHLISNAHSWNIGSFSIDEGDSSENVTFKMNSRFFKFCRAYSSSLKMWNVGEFLRSWLLGEHTQVLKEREEFVVACLRPPQNVKLGIFTS